MGVDGCSEEKAELGGKRRGGLVWRGESERSEIRDVGGLIVWMPLRPSVAVGLATGCLVEGNDADEQAATSYKLQALDAT